MSDILDLDIIKPKKQAVRLNGKVIDISFIPCGITFEIDNIVRELMKLNQEEVTKGGEETKKALDWTMKLCATFTSVENPDMNENWFKKHVSAEQANMMAEKIKDTLLRSYDNVKEYTRK